MRLWLLIKKALNGIDENRYFKVLFSVTGFLASVATIIGLAFIYPELTLTNRQLGELNKDATIDVSFSLATSTRKLVYGPTVTEPTDISIIPRNNGQHHTSAWRIHLIFCKGISVKATDTQWETIESGNKGYVYESQKPLRSSLELGIHSDALDRIGTFQIVIPTGTHGIFQQKVPIALVTSAGERAETQMTFVTMDKSDFYYEKVSVNNRGVLSPDVSDCQPYSIML